MNKRLGIAAFLACAACCAIPLLAAAGIGGSTAATLSAFFTPGAELIFGAVVFVVVLGGLYLRSKLKGPATCGASCKLDGSCCNRASA